MEWDGRWGDTAAAGLRNGRLVDLVLAPVRHRGTGNNKAGSNASGGEGIRDCLWPNDFWDCGVLVCAVDDGCCLIGRGSSGAEAEEAIGSYIILPARGVGGGGLEDEESEETTFDRPRIILLLRMRLLRSSTTGSSRFGGAAADDWVKLLRRAASEGLQFAGRELLSSVTAAGLAY